MTTKNISPIRAAIFALTTAVSFCVHASNAFDAATNRLTLESLSVGGQGYKAIALTVNDYSVLTVGSGTPTADTFDPSTNVLTMGRVAVQGTTYTNVQVRINSYTLLSVSPGSTYAGEPAVAFDLINSERQTCGFGLVKQNASLDAAAAAHAAYTPQSVVQGEDLHSEVPGRAGFTGNTATERGAKAGYLGLVGEVMGLGTGTTAVHGLLSGPYHLRGLMDGYRDIGIGMVASSIPELPYFVGNLGIQTGVGLQQLSSTDVATYPCNGVAGVNYQLRGEIPNPVPGRDLSANPIGTPILIKVRDGNVLYITNAAMINVSTGAGVVLRAPVGAANDPNRANGVAYFKASEAYIAPDAPLLTGTTYQTTVVGTNNGIGFSKTFTFTTGTGVN